MPKIRVRARALDMLGRQQMASIPNALHELFKNAHDAYADHVEVDYYRRSGILVLRDDGVGMTREEFESRWLTLGTESKVQDGGMVPPYRDPQKLERVLLGEKGIGRLAIATVGPQVFVLTRAEREDGLQELVTAFINWTFFEIPGLGLDDIDIPIFTSNSPHEDCNNILADSVQHYVELLASLGDNVSDLFRSRILNELGSFEKRIANIVGKIKGLSIMGGRGTAFIVHPVDDLTP